MIRHIKKLYKKDIAFNIGIQFIERLVNLVLAFVSSIFIIRYFSPSDYGVFAYANSYVTLFAALTSMGVNSIVVRELVEKRLLESEVMGSSFMIMFLGSTLALLVISLTSMMSNNSITTNWIICIYAFGNIISSLQVMNFYFQARTKTKLTSFVLLIQDFLDFILRLSLIYLKADLIWFAIEGLFSTIIVYMTLYLFYRRESLNLKWLVSIRAIKYIFIQSLPLALSGAMINLFMRLDQVMLEHFSGLKAVAEYSVGIKLVEMTYMIPMIIAPNIFPLLITVHKDSELKFDKFFIKLLRYCIGVAGIIVLFLFIFGPALVHLLYGVKYQNTGSVLRWASLCIPPVFVGVLSGIWLQIKKLQNMQFYQMLMGLLICIGLNYILIPRYGVMGAVIGIVVAQFTASIFSTFFFRNLRPLLGLYLMAAKA